jgi:2'-5' RNA ligase
VDGARFLPHLTLGRANRSIDTTRLVRVLDTFDSDGWVADELVLVQSHLADRGNRYEVVDRWGLGFEQRD